MVVTSVYNSWDVFYGRDRNTIHKTFEDPVTRKHIVEEVQFLYTKNGTIEVPDKGNNIDKKV